MFVKQSRICPREDGRMGKSTTENTPSEMLVCVCLHPSDSEDVSPAELGAPREDVSFIPRRFHHRSAVLNPSSAAPEEVRDSSFPGVRRDQGGVWDPEDGGDVSDSGQDQQ